MAHSWFSVLTVAFRCDWPGARQAKLPWSHAVELGFNLTLGEAQHWSQHTFRRMAFKKYFSQLKGIALQNLEIAEKYKSENKSTSFEQEATVAGVQCGAQTQLLQRSALLWV